MKKLVIRGDYTAKNLLLITEDTNGGFAPFGQIKHIKGQTWEFNHVGKNYTVQGTLEKLIIKLLLDFSLLSVSREYWTVETKQAARAYILDSWNSYESEETKNLHGVVFSEFGEAKKSGSKRDYYVHIRTILEQLQTTAV